MSRKTSFKEQMIRALNSLNCFGQSKYLAKQESYKNGNKGKISGIYSKKTMQDYKKVAEQFSVWTKDNGFRFKNLNDVSNEHILQYLIEKQNKGVSPWTISHDLSALNKIFSRDISKKGTILKSRKNADIKNNRGLGNNYRPSVYARNKDLISFLSATGIRRQSITSIRPSDAIRNDKDIIIGFRLLEKGGKSRNAYVIKNNQTDITAFVDNHLKEHGNTPFWNKVNKNLNTHWYRAEYANTLYKDLLNASTKGLDYFDGYKEYFIDSAKLTQATSGHRKTTKGYDTQCLAMVSQNLGHNRIDVVYTNYLNRF